MEENNSQSNKVAEAGKKVAKKSVKKVVNSGFFKRYVLPVIVVFLIILLALGCILAVSQFIVDIFASVLGVFSSNDEPISVVAETYDNTILGAAAQIYEEEIGWKYFEDLDELSSSVVSKQLVNPNKATCCSTYVSCVLYASGYASEEELAWQYHQPNFIRELLAKKGWEQISSVENIEPGDILFYYRDGAWMHTDIYYGVSEAGYMLWYDGGKIEEVTSSLPVVNQKNWSSYEIIEIYRPPAEAPYPPAERPNQDHKGELLSIDKETGLYKYNCEDLADKVIEELKASKVDTEKFNFKKLENNIQKYIDIEIATSYPKITDLTNFLWNEADGKIVIKRASTDAEKVEKKVENLKYVKYEEFCEEVSKGSTEMLHKFSINPHTLALCIAKQGDSITFLDFNGNKMSNSSEGSMTIEEINYRKLIEDQITPVNFLLTIHLISQNDDFMEDVLKLIKENDEPITLTYVDTEYESHEIRDYEGEVVYKYSPSGGYEWPTDKLGAQKFKDTIDKDNVADYYEDIEYHEMITTKHRGKMYVSYAKTWLTTASKKISDQLKILGGKDSARVGEPTEVAKGDVYPSTFVLPVNEEDDEGVEVTRTGKYTVNEIITTYGVTKKFTITGRSKKINVDDFVKLIKKYPDVEENFTSSPSYLFDLLYEDTKTQRMEKIMRFVMYKLTDKYYGVLEADLYDKYTASVSRNNYSILDMAQKIHDEEIDWTYSTDREQLKTPITKQLENSNKVTNSAAYVSCVLYKTELLTDGDIFSVMGEFLSVDKLDQKLSELEWERIDDRDKFVAGDIVFYGSDSKKPIDVLIYAGKNSEEEPLWYCASSTEDIQGSAPKRTEKDWPTEIVWAYRAPKNGTFERVSDVQYIGGYYTALDGRVFTIFDQGQCDAVWKNGPKDEGKCNRVATCIVASGFPNISEDVPIYENPTEIVENMTAKYNDIIPDNFLKEYGLVPIFDDQYRSLSKYPDAVKEQIESGGYALIWLDARQKTDGYIGKSGRCYTKLYHWLAILDYRETEDGEEQMLVADSCNAIWYDIDEFLSGLAHFVRINKIEKE